MNFKFRFHFLVFNTTLNNQNILLSFIYFKEMIPKVIKFLLKDIFKSIFLEELF